MQQVMHWKKRTVDICTTSLVTAIMVKMELMKPYLDVTYYTSPGPIFYVDSEYDVRNQIWDLCQVLWVGLC